MCTKLGKIIYTTFFAKSLDKMAGWWYNGISGAGIRQRAAKKVNIAECTKNSG